MSMMSKALVSVSVLSTMLLVVTLVTLTANDPRAAFQGVWRTAEVVVPGPTPQVFRPEATLAIFHGRHYSRVEVHAERPRPVLKDRGPHLRTSCAPCGVPSSVRPARSS